MSSKKVMKIQQRKQNRGRPCSKIEAFTLVFKNEVLFELR